MHQARFQTDKYYYIKTIFTSVAVFLFFVFTLNFVIAADNLSQKLSGRILLQVEENGEAWYVNPSDNKKYFLGRPSSAFDLMKNLSIGITNENLEKIPIGLIGYDDNDNDNDGLPNRLENALGTDQNNSDSDGDGYDDGLEVANNYDPLGASRLPVDEGFVAVNLGKIFLQIENSGQAWYINPMDKKRYYLGRPADTFGIMRQFGMGISNKNISKISTGFMVDLNPLLPDSQPCSICQSANQAMLTIANAIKSGNINSIKNNLSPHTQAIFEYNIDYLDVEGRSIWADNLFLAALSNPSPNASSFFVNINYSGMEATKEYKWQKQEDNSWLLTNP
jgi:hypothetical protein